jgi:hypothetical protein
MHKSATPATDLTLAVWIGPHFRDVAMQDSTYGTHAFELSVTEGVRNPPHPVMTNR